MPHEPANAVYYWKTVFSLSSGEQEFIRENHIKRIYVRFFDVIVEDTDLNGEEEIVPNATVKFQTNQIPVKEIIPTVYITLDALKAMKGKESHWAMTIARRIANMCSYNEIRQVGEVQLDCDWTKSTQDSYFVLCTQLANAFNDIITEDDSWKDVFTASPKISTTIRLHQLAMPAPPVDCGVLMVYNTGSFKNPSAENSIISYDEVKPYLKKRNVYPLPLDVAYPTYSWGLLYRKGKFSGILREIENIENDTTAFDREKNNYAAKKDLLFGNILVHKGNTIRIEKSDFTEVMKVKNLIEPYIINYSPDYSIILYHLDSLNLSKYSGNEISKIYTRRNR